MSWLSDELRQGEPDCLAESGRVRHDSQQGCCALAEECLDRSDCEAARDEAVVAEDLPEAGLMQDEIVDLLPELLAAEVGIGVELSLPVGDLGGRRACFGDQ
jgi:hypothetical protein